MPGLKKMNEGTTGKEVTTSGPVPPGTKKILTGIFFSFII